MALWSLGHFGGDQRTAVPIFPLPTSLAFAFVLVHIFLMCVTSPATCLHLSGLFLHRDFDEQCLRHLSCFSDCIGGRRDCTIVLHRTYLRKEVESLAQACSNMPPTRAGQRLSCRDPVLNFMLNYQCRDDFREERACMSDEMQYSKCILIQQSSRPDTFASSSSSLLRAS